MKKILFISFYWLPSGKASLHWPLKMVEYITQFGCDSVVLTVKKDTATAEDYSLTGEVSPNLKVIRSAFWDPYILYNKFLGNPADEPLTVTESISNTEPTLKQKISLWIRMNLFVPDGRIGWYFPGLKAAGKYLKKNNIDLIVSNGPPHSTHLIGKKLSKKFNIPLVTVFIDPWVDISYYKGHKRNPLIVKFDNRLERSVIKHSSKVVFVTKGLVKYFSEKYPGEKNKFELLYWGYNEEDFAGLVKHKDNDYEILLHAGNMYDHQNPTILWKTLQKEIKNGRKLKIKFVGTVGPAVKKSINENNLTKHTEFLGFLPYKKVVQEMMDADYLLVCVAEPRHVPGKLFEYMRTGNSILAFGESNAEVEQLLQETGSGMLFKYDENPQNFFEEQIQLGTNIEKVKKFDRKQIAEQFALILKNMYE